MKNLFFYFSISIFFFSCSNKQKELSLIGSNYTINLDGEQDVHVPLSSFFKNVKPIILETNEDCLIGKIDELQVFDGRIYVLDKLIAKSLFVFDMDGRFIKKIGNLGQGPGEYIQLGDFTIDTKNRFIFLLDWGAYAHKYHLDGTFVQTVTPQLSDANFDFIQFYNDKLYLYVKSRNSTPESHVLMVADPNDGKILSSDLSLKYNKGWSEPFFTGHSFFMSRLNDPPRFTQLFMDYIVSIGEDITPHIELKSENLTTEEDVKKMIEISDPIRKMQPLEGSLKIWDVRNFVENDDFIIFTYYNGSFNHNIAVYNKKTKSVKLAKYFNNDLIYKKDEKSSHEGFVFSDSKGAYEILQPRVMGYFLKYIRDNEILLNLDKADELLNLKEDSNPVIFYYEFK